MAWLMKLLRSKRAFTLAEVSVASAMLLSLMSIVSVIPIYKAQLSTVTIKQKANAVAKEVVSQLENQSENATPSIDLDGNILSINSSPQNLAAGGPTVVTRTFGTDANDNDVNINYRVFIESFNIEVITDVNGNGSMGDEVDAPDGSNTFRVSVAVHWEGFQCGMISQEHTMRNTSAGFNYNNQARQTSAQQCPAQASQNRCYCTASANSSSCTKTACRCGN